MNNFLSALIGIFISIMILFNGTLSKYLGNTTTAVVFHLLGCSILFFILIFSRSKLNLKKKFPVYLLLSGSIGILPIYFNNIGFAVLGISIPIALSLLGQSITSIIIDHFGLFDMNIIRFDKRKLVGLMIISFGIFVMTFS